LQGDVQIKNKAMARKNFNIATADVDLEMTSDTATRPSIGEKELKPMTGQSSTSPPPATRRRVAVIGSGNWGSTACRIAAANVLRHPDIFEPEVRMWV
jgi:hypothetical protein